MAKVKTMYSADPLSAREALERIFSTTASPEVAAELRKWLRFGQSGEGNTLHTLTAEQLALFTDKIQDLSLALYVYQQGVQKGGDHES